jgi:hypothetical protein
MWYGSAATRQGQQKVAGEENEQTRALAAEAEEVYSAMKAILIKVQTVLARSKLGIRWGVGKNLQHLLHLCKKFHALQLYRARSAS